MICRSICIVDLLPGRPHLNFHDFLKNPIVLTLKHLPTVDVVQCSPQSFPYSSMNMSMKQYAYLIYTYTIIYIHCITVWKTESTPKPEELCLVCAAPKKQTLHSWCQGRRVFAWKVPSSFRQVGGAFRQWGCQVRMLRNNNFKKQDAGWMIRQDDWRWLDVDFFSQNMFLYVFGILGVFFWRMRIVFILEFCRSSNYMFSSHRWDY